MGAPPLAGRQCVFEQCLGIGFDTPQRAIVVKRVVVE
jgi:hypothetical protein